MYNEDSEVDDFLEHVGVKGMKWGVRNDRGHEGEQAKTKTIAKLDKKYEKSFSGSSGFIKMHNEMADHMNARLGGLNEKFKDVDVRVPGTKGHTDYHKAYEGIIAESAKAAMKNFGTNASGTGRVKITQVGKGEDAWWQAEWEEIKHATNGALRIKVMPKFDVNGFIVSQTVTALDEDSVKHDDERIEMSDNNTDEFLAHFGVKGMKWGHHKAHPDGGSAGPSRREQKRDARARDREMNKQSERKEAARIIKKSKSEKNEVEAARMRTYSGANAVRLKEAKEKYKSDKVAIGSREAKRILNSVRREVSNDYAKSQQVKDGYELVNNILDSMGNTPHNEFQREADLYRQYRNV